MQLIPVNDSEFTEVVYSRDMGEKGPTVAILHERVTTAIKVITYLGIVVVVTMSSVAAYLHTRSSDHGERLSRVEGKLDSLIKSVDRMLDRQAKNTLKASAAASPEEIKNASTRLRERKVVVSTGEIQQASEPLLRNVNQQSWGSARGTG